MFKKLQKEWKLWRYYRGIKGIVFYSKYLDRHLIVRAIIDWDNWIGEVHYYHNSHGWIPGMSNTRFFTSDYDIRKFVAAQEHTERKVWIP